MISSFRNQYAEKLYLAIRAVEQGDLDRALNEIHTTRQRGKKIFVGGNGGSASISEHLTCDFMKGCEHKLFPNMSVHSLSSNFPLISAIANDISYEEVFSKQLEYHMAAGDLVILISSSGNSSNIIKAAEYTRSKNATLIGMTGFTGGRLKELAHISLHIPVDNYGIVEDAHQALMHILAQYHKEELDEAK